MARREEGPGFNPLGWMFTFSDLVTLLLTFFVMLLAMKEPEATRLKDMFGIFAGGSQTPFAVGDQGGSREARAIIQSMLPPRRDALEDPDQLLAEELALGTGGEGLPRGSLQKGIKLRRDQRGLVITLANDMMFAPGSAKLSPKAGQVIAKAARLLKSVTNDISVEGNTDSAAPGAGSPYVDNWALSLARAEAVLHVLLNKEKIDPRRLRVAALGDTRPLAPNDTPEHRAMNRRTELVLLMKKKK